MPFLITKRTTYKQWAHMFTGTFAVSIPFTGKVFISKIPFRKFFLSLPVQFSCHGITIRTSSTETGDLQYFIQIFGKAPTSTPSCSHDYSPCGCSFRNYLGTKLGFIHRYQEGIIT